MTGRATSAARRVTVDLGARSYDVVVGRGAASELATLLAGRRRAVVVSQEAVAGPHAPSVLAALDAAGVAHQLLLMGDGEAAKCVATVEDLARRAAAWGLLRGDVVVALGGGVVGDTAGFLAACYHRGVAVVQVPTSLLAMVDAAIGGKTGVNLPEGKNLLGAFHQPLGVLADPGALATLPEREYRSGLGEVAKYALLGDAELAGLIERDADRLTARDPDALVDVVARSAAAKAAVVAVDELEQTGRRARLNYGHTLAHAIETTAGYEILHGEAVAIGLVFAAELAAALERVPPRAVDEHRRLVAALGLPSSAPPGLHGRDLLDVMGRDKKSAGGLTFVLAGTDGVDLVHDPDRVAVAKALAAVGIAT